MGYGQFCLCVFLIYDGAQFFSDFATKGILCFPKLDNFFTHIDRNGRLKNHEIDRCRHSNCSRLISNAGHKPSASLTFLLFTLSKLPGKT